VNAAAGSIPQAGRVAGIDFGTVRIGVAVTDLERRLASPLENYTRRGREGDARFFQRLVEAENLVGFVVGLPVHASGAESEKSREARAFGQWLQTATGLPVEYYDERYTTAEAETLLGEAGMTRKRRKARLDMLAAQILLSAWLEAKVRGGRPPEALED
jgi:putative Holliday junction resolvase